MRVATNRATVGVDISEIFPSEVWRTHYFAPPDPALRSPPLARSSTRSNSADRARIVSGDDECLVLGTGEHAKISLRILGPLEHR